MCFPSVFSHFRTSSNLSVVLTNRPYTTLALHQWLVEPEGRCGPRFFRTRCEITRRNGPKINGSLGVKYHHTYRGCKVITYNSVSTTGWGPPCTPLKMKMLNPKNRLYHQPVILSRPVCCDRNITRFSPLLFRTRKLSKVSPTMR